MNRLWKRARLRFAALAVAREAHRSELNFGSASRFAARSAVVRSACRVRRASLRRTQKASRQGAKNAKDEMLSSWLCASARNLAALREIVRVAVKATAGACLFSPKAEPACRVVRSRGADHSGNPDWAAFRDIVFRSLRFPFPGRRMQDDGLSDRQSTDASDRAVDSRVVLVRTHDRLQHFWSRTG